MCKTRRLNFYGQGYSTSSTVQIRLEPRTNDLTTHYVPVVVVSVSLDATSTGIGLFCRLMPSASNSALPCTATRARCFSMSTPNEGRDLSSNHGSWARSWISLCTQTSEMNSNSESHRERTTGSRSARRRPAHVICTFRDTSELNVATRRCCNCRVAESWPLTSKDFVDRNFKWRRRQIHSVFEKTCLRRT